jgi:hypothetical protein
MKVPLAIGLKEQPEVTSRLLFFAVDSHHLPLRFLSSGQPSLKDNEFTLSRVRDQTLGGEESNGGVDKLLGSLVAVREERYVVRINHAEEFSPTKNRTVNVSSRTRQDLHQTTNKENKKSGPQTRAFVDPALDKEQSMTRDPIEQELKFVFGVKSTHECHELC